MFGKEYVIRVKDNVLSLMVPDIVKGVVVKYRALSKADILMGFYVQARALVQNRL